MELPTNRLIICLVPFILMIKPISSQFLYINELCRGPFGNYTVNSTYNNNLNLLLSDLKNQASLSLFNNDTVGEGIDQTYGLYMCRSDLNFQQCRDCVSAASTTIIEKCPVQKEAIIWYYECMVRYANRSIFSLFEELPNSYTWSTGNFSDPGNFSQIFSPMMNALIMDAAYNTSGRGYATSEANVTLYEPIYTVAQCTPDINGSQCERCLRAALRRMRGCCGTARRSLAMFLPSCWLRYASAPIVGVFGSSVQVTPSSPSIPFDFNPPSGSNNPTLQPPRLSPGSSTAATIISGGLGLVLRILMAVIMTIIMAW